MATSSLTPGWTNRPVYSRATTLGLAVYLLILIIFAALITITIDPADALFVVLFAVPSIVIIGLTLYFGSWALIVGAVWALLNLVMNAPSILPSLTHVDSFFDFGLSLPLIVSLVVATVGGVTAFVQNRRGTARTAATGSEKRVFSAIIVVVVGLMVLSGILQIATTTTVSAEDKVGAVEVAMEDIEFAPARINVAADSPSKLAVKNEDLIVHNLTIEALDISVSITGGSEKLIELPSLAAGTYEYVCTVPGHDDMKGTLVVQ